MYIFFYRIQMIIHTCFMPCFYTSHEHSFLLIKILRKYVVTVAHYSTGCIEKSLLTPPPMNGHRGSSLVIYFFFRCRVILWAHFPMVLICLSLPLPLLFPSSSLLRFALAWGSLHFPWARRETVSSVAQLDWWPCCSRRCLRVSLRRTWWAGPCPTWPRPCRLLGKLCTVTTSLAMRMSCPSGWSPAPRPMPRSRECRNYTRGNTKGKNMASEIVFLLQCFSESCCW